MANLNGNTILKTVPSGIIALDKWIKDVGISRMTAYRWRERGILKTHNLYGRQYITSAHVAELQRRLQAGEFHKTVNIEPARLAREAKARRGNKAVAHA